MDEKLQNGVFTEHAQTNKASPSLESDVVCIAILSILQELRRLEGRHAMHDELLGTLKCSRRVDVLVCWDPFIKTLMAGQLLDGFLGEVVFLVLLLEV